VLDKLESGYRMPRPEGCPAETYGLMRECWNYNADKRKLLPLLRVEAFDGVCCQEASPAHTPSCFVGPIDTWQGLRLWR